MKQERKQIFLENLTYALIWLVVFLFPFFRTTQQSTFDWDRACFYWGMITPFFIIFLVNNYLLVPYLLIRKKYWQYLVLTLLVIFLILTVRHLIIENYRKQPFPSGKELSFPPHDNVPAFRPGGPMRPGMPGDRRRYAPPDSIRYDRPPLNDSLVAPFRREGRPGMRPLSPGIPFGMTTPLLYNWFIAILLVGFNVAIRLLFKSMRDDRQMKDLEKYSLETELNYLKAQINPHFFMNTLNNIHALIDIDTEKAKETIIELSRLMRYVLYDASNARVSLVREVEFLHHYIELMKIRYPGHIDIRVSFPDTVPDISIPPLLMMTFVENAFKHGISYKNDSFIHISLIIKEKSLEFFVTNSNVVNKMTARGVGLENVNKRLRLLYGDNYTLKLEETAEQHHVLLIIPIEL